MSNSTRFAYISFIYDSFIYDSFIDILFFIGVYRCLMISGLLG